MAVFVVDSFTGRGIKNFRPETELSRAGQVYDPWYRDPVDPESDRTPTSPDTDGR